MAQSTHQAEACPCRGRAPAVRSEACEVCDCWQGTSVFRGQGGGCALAVFVLTLCTVCCVKDYLVSVFNTPQRPRSVQVTHFFGGARPPRGAVPSMFGFPLAFPFAPLRCVPATVRDSAHRHERCSPSVSARHLRRSTRTQTSGRERSQTCTRGGQPRRKILLHALAKSPLRVAVERAVQAPL